MVATVVWGTGNVGRAAIRAVDVHPGLRLAAVLVHGPAKVGHDAGHLADLGHELGVTATDDVDAVLAPPLSIRSTTNATLHKSYENLF